MCEKDGDKKQAVIGGFLKKEAGFGSLKKILARRKLVIAAQQVLSIFSHRDRERK